MRSTFFETWSFSEIVGHDGPPTVHSKQPSLVLFYDIFAASPSVIVSRLSRTRYGEVVQGQNGGGSIGLAEVVVAFFSEPVSNAADHAFHQREAEKNHHDVEYQSSGHVQVELFQ